jgi:hypothetical protein
MPREIRADEAARFVANRRDLWEAMHRHGWYLPRFGPAVTLAYLHAVRSGNVWCPRYDDVRLRPCLVPPPTKQLLEWVEEALQLQRHGNPDRSVLLGFAANRLPDQQWALHALSTLEPRHRIFGKGYVREPPPLAAVNQTVVDNADGLYDGLPQLPLPKGKARRHTVRLQPTREERLQRLRARRDQLQARGEQLAA